MKFFPIAILSSLLVLTKAAPQGPNTIATKYPLDRTYSANGTWFILPVTRTVVEAAIAPRRLLNPTSDPVFFPGGFPAGKYPVVVSSAYINDLEQGILTAPALLNSNILVPWVDLLGDNKTPFTVSLRQYFNSRNNGNLNTILTNLITAFSGTPFFLGQFNPADKHATVVNANTFSFGVRATLLPPTPVGVVPPIFVDFLTATFSPNLVPAYPSHTLTRLLNNSTVIYDVGVTCSRQYYYFHELFAGQAFRTGTVTLANTAATPAGFAGTYTNVYGFSGNAVVVNFNGEPCLTAPANNRPFLIPTKKKKKNKGKNKKEKA